jgi:hypothetical protein
MKDMAINIGLSIHLRELLMISVSSEADAQTIIGQTTMAHPLTTFSKLHNNHLSGLEVSKSFV